MAVPGGAVRSPLRRLHTSDDVMITRHAVPAGMPLLDGRIVAARPIPQLMGLGDDEFAPWQPGATV